MATRATLLNTQTDYLTAHRLPNDAIGLNVNGLNGILGLSLNPSAPTFQPTVGDPLGDATNAGQAGFEHLPGPGPMSAQQYEALLDLNYVANQQWERAEMQRQIDQVRAEQICGQQVSRGSAQTV